METNGNEPKEIGPEMSRTQREVWTPVTLRSAEHYEALGSTWQHSKNNER